MIRAILIAAAIVALARCSNAPPQASVFGASQPQSISSPPTARVVDVPGPIGVLGVVAAFGWSRRLRRRVKAAQLIETQK